VCQKLLEKLFLDLLNYIEIWAVAGTPNAVFNLSPKDVKMTEGQVVDVKKS
jgi:hypothetical protein